ncbi:type I restriction enzyme HsdR N-terminal domain-containing protein [Reichenbachiella agariperforans]|uniref:Type I restriction enzyme R protein N terminus (HSDR_N) n=2 Tax=Reichenbachiellaceae TaxID=2762302 RepID=A0A1M6LC46_REIAG|nr:type I restriction enzyme HsdR N-terminal domain-containing protein [Reichenbachiella agariperforans]RJE75392.1 restriction endonuclease subunit R [Reichenbachiella sp. MSK19-1]SHJ68801.1 Type I restriction enzyme R protein N terminus (HSDR_N) [Reichenbachiella agariperforans]
MERLNLPPFNFNIRESTEGNEIWDEFRKKYIVLTPEEWVRQNFLRFLNQYLSYPRTLLKVEGSMKYNKLSKRPDIVAYSSSGAPIMLVECKASYVKITEETFKQASVYNKVVRARYLVVTNGLQHFICEQNFETGTSLFLKEIPVYQV